MAEPKDCLGAGGCLETSAEECAAAACNAVDGPIDSFNRDEPEFDQ